MYQHKAPHRNWQPGPKHLNWLDDVTISEPETLWDDYSNRASPAAKQTMTIKKHLNSSDLKLTPPKNLTPEQLKKWNDAYKPKNEAFEKARPNMSEKEVIKWKYQRYVKDYLRCVKSVDENLGRILDHLDKAGLAKNTLVMYSSDQGWYLGEHGWFDKRWMYEESFKTPLLARWPGQIKPGSVNDELTSNLDFAETFLDVAGVPVPQDMQGRSLVPLFRGKTPADWRKTFYYHYYEFPGAHSVARHYGVADKRHKLIHYYQVGEWELLDLEKDPNELKSVYGQKEYAEIQAKLLAELKRLRQELKVPEQDPATGRKTRRKQPRKKGKAGEKK
jgi:arylsulfatase A-like enzyme